MKRHIAILLMILLLTACGAGGQAPAQQPESSSSPISEPAPEPDSEPDPGSTPDPAPQQAPDEGSEWDPDPGTGIPDPGPDETAVDRARAMIAYLEENLDPWDYSGVMLGGDGGLVEVYTPSPDAVKSVVEAYTGETVPVEYYHEAFSKGQVEQAREDAERFLEQHPEIELLDIRTQLGIFSGWIINVKEESSALTGFVKSYPIADIYEVVVGVHEFPD